MTPRLRELERVEHRVLGALDCVDGTTGARVDAPIEASADGARFVRNASGLLVLYTWSGLAAHAEAFETPPALPAMGSLALDVTLRDPSAQYLPRRFRLRLPRDPDPGNAGDPASLLRAQRVPLQRSPTAPVIGNWAVLAVHVAEQASGDALGGALLELRTPGGVLLAQGLTDWRGEALLPVAGIPVTTWANDDDEAEDVVVTEIATRLVASFDPGTGTRTPDAQVRAGRAPDRLPLVDPDLFAGNAAVRSSPAAALPLSARGARPVNLSIALP